MAPDTTITVSVSYSADQLEFVIENHKGTYPIEELQELNTQLMTYDCHGYEVLSYTINTIDMYPVPKSEHWDSIKDFLAEDKYEEQCK
jgi:hypothetical protein